MKRSNANPKDKSKSAQPKIIIPVDTLRSIMQAIAVQHDSSMTRVYSIIQPKSSS